MSGEIQQTLLNLYENPDDMHDLIRYITDFELRMADEICSHLHPDALFHHDDWGTQKSSFMSPANRMDPAGEANRSTRELLFSLSSLTVFLRNTLRMERRRAIRWKRQRVTLFLGKLPLLSVIRF